MRLPFIIGIAVALLLLVAGIAAPLFRSAAKRDADRAMAQAHAARQELVGYSQRLPLLVQRVPAQPEEAQIEAAAQDPNVKAQFQQIGAAPGRVAAKLREQGLTAPEVQPPTGNAAGLRRALGDFQKAAGANQQKLQAALSAAKAADGNVFGVAHVQGMAEYTRAAGLLEEAELLHQRQNERLAALLGLAAEWKSAQGQADHYRGMDVAPILARLKADLGDLAEMRQEAEARATEMGAEVAQREGELKQIEEEMRGARDALLKLESTGFAAGDDAAFERYRREYLALTAELDKLQSREQELRFGGRPGAELVGPDPAGGELRGGEPLIGLEVLRRRLEMAQDTAQQMSSAHQSLEAQITFVTESGRTAQAEAQRYAARMEELARQQQAALADVLAIAKEGLEKQTNALQAATAAVSAFGNSQRAASEYVRAAGAARERDKSGQNAVLKTIQGDPYLEQFGAAAQASAQVLAGRVHWLRLQSHQRLIDELQRFVEIKPDISVELEKAQEYVKTARESGTDVLTKALETYRRLAGVSRPPAGFTAYNPLAALAAAAHLMSLIDPAQADKYLAEAREAIAKAVDKREAHPHAAPLAPFRDYIAGPPPEPSAATDELFGDQPAAEPNAPTRP